MAESASDTDVLVVGAGPTGLLLASELALAGVTTTLVERRDSESNLTRAFAVHARTLELLDARGLAADLIDGGQTISAIRLFGTVDLDLSRLPTAFPHVLITPQYEVERVLRERAEALGVEFLRGTEATALRQDPEGVTVELRSHEGVAQTRRASYVVGADGVRSTVRHILSEPFPGRAAVMRSVVLADARLAEAPPTVLTVNGTGDGFAFIAPFGDGWYRIIAWDRHRQLPDDAPVELDEVRQITRRLLGTDFGMHDARWLSRFHNDERQVRHYRRGRVFLAGDAAHVHTPAGGQGMNTGLQDAFNLGWKLAAVVNGHVRDTLLDSYHTERYPVGRTVIRMTHALLHLVVLPTPPLRAVRGVLGAAAMHIKPIADHAAGALSGIAIGYPAEPGAHPLTGKRASDVRLAGDGDPARLYEALRNGRFILLTGSADASAPTGWNGRVDVFPAADPNQPLTLVRPDGYIAWATEQPDPNLRNRELITALTRWCGARQPQSADRDRATSGG